MALRSVMASKIPLVIIVGATGTGKTKLSVELAQKFGTEIISADSMQIYKGLDVVTAKASKQEREAVRHHMLDILEPHQMCTVVDFRNRTLKIIDNLTEQGKIPIVVGGTNYYIESIVYRILVEDVNETQELLWDRTRKRGIKEADEENDEVPIKKPDVDTSVDPTDKKEDNVNHEKIIENTEVERKKMEITKESVKKNYDNNEKLSNEEVHQLLADIDPAMADRLHPNNRRKILRSVEVWLNTGKRHSEILAEQKLSEGQLRRPGAVLFLWLKCEQGVHEKRLDSRVDAMLEEGLIQELLDFHDRHNKQRILDGQPADYTKGIFQTLGFKEFHEYLMLSPEQRESDNGKALLQNSIANMKLGTRRYARRQNKMVKGRFLQHPHRQVPPIYELDTTDISKWNEEVRNKAIYVIESYLSGTSCKYEPLKSDINEEKKNKDRSSRNFCSVCERLILGDEAYEIHLKSFRHMKVLNKKKREESKKKCQKNSTA